MGVSCLVLLGMGCDVAPPSEDEVPVEQAAEVVSDGQEVVERESEEETEVETEEPALAEDNQKQVIEENTQEEVQEQEQEEEQEVEPSSGVYADYSEGAVSDAQSSGQRVVLFFHASWCPFCKRADGEFLSAQDQIPAGVSLFKVEYDTSSELKQKYGVTYQHTFVEIDSNGEAVNTWVSGGLEELIANTN